MAIESFIEENRLGASAADFEKLTEIFVKQMECALTDPSMNMMIDAHVKTTFEIKPNKNVVVIDAGGTNLRTCLVHFDEKLNPVISDFSKTSMPGIAKEVSADEFFNCFADRIENLITKADLIGWCFSYAAKILDNGDGIPLGFSKEIKAPQVLGKHLGLELFKVLEKRGIDTSNKKIVVMNDTVTTLLATLSQMKAKGCGSCIGFILGTGTNTAIGRNGRIYNVESGQFDYICSEIDRKIINATTQPDFYHLEKHISGVYLGTICEEAAKLALSQGLVSALPEGKIDTIQAGNLLEGKESILDVLPKSDRETLIKLFSAIVERSAKLTAANLASAILMSDHQGKPVLINADGSTFYKTIGLAEKTEMYLNNFLKTKGLKAVFTKIEDSPTVGCAIGALSLDC